MITSTRMAVDVRLFLAMRSKSELNIHEGGTVNVPPFFYIVEPSVKIKNATHI